MKKLALVTVFMFSGGSLYAMEKPSLRDCSKTDQKKYTSMSPHTVDPANITCHSSDEGTLYEGLNLDGNTLSYYLAADPKKTRSECTYEAPSTWDLSYKLTLHQNLPKDACSILKEKYEQHQAELADLMSWGLSDIKSDLAQIDPANIVHIRTDSLDFYRAPVDTCLSYIYAIFRNRFGDKKIAFKEYDGAWRIKLDPYDCREIKEIYEK